MNKQITRLTLDLSLRDSYKVVFAKMGDTERRVIVEIKDNGEDYSLAGVNTVEVRCRKADGKQVTKNATKDNNTIVINISGQMTTCKGTAIVDVVLYGTGGGVLSTAKFYLNVDDGAVSEDDIKSSNEYESLTDALRTVGLAKEVADTALNTANTAEEKVEKLLEKTVDFERQGEQIVKNKEDIGSLKENVGELDSEIFSVTQQYEKVLDGLVELDKTAISKISDTSFTVEKSTTDSILVGCPVSNGEKIKISCTSANVYNALGYVWSTASDTPPYWNGSNAVSMLSSEEYDYFCGNTSTENKDLNIELDVPFGAKAIWIRRLGNTPTIYKLKDVKESKIPTKTSQLENDGLVRNTIFSLPAPTVSVGTVENQMLHTLHNENVPLWKFQEVGTIDFEGVSVPHNSSDTVGLWIYCNETMLSYRENTGGVMDLFVNDIKIDAVLVAYKFRVGWNYLPIKVTENKFNLKINFTLVRGNYEFAVDSIELNYVPKVKPKILLSFDMSGETMYTNRHLLLKEYGFRATYCNVWDISEINRNKMLAYGDDWAIYGNDSTSNTVYPGDNATVEEFEEYLQKTIDRSESIGLFNPISYFSPNNAGFQNLMQALKNKGYRIGRTAASGQYAVDYFGKDSFYINTYGVGGEETSANVLKAVDDAINAGNSICIFTHDILESPSDNMNAKKSTYVEILDGIKDRVNAGKCEVCTFTDFYREWMPNDCAAYLKSRHEKEKQYNIGKLSSLKEELSNKITKFYASNQGETHITDSDNGKIQDMMLYGKSSQDGTPTPENPVEIKSVVNPTVKVTNEDGLKVQSVTLNNITLNAIPVKSGGNVTIDGQQYIADYVDVERGKLVRMCKRETFNTKNGRIDEEYRLAIENGHTASDGSKKCIFSAFTWTNWETCANGNFTYIKNIKKLNNELYTAQELKELSLDFDVVYQLLEQQETDLTTEQTQALKEFVTYYPATNISVNSEQLDGYTVFNYPISMQNGWNYVKQQLNDNRDYIYDMDLQSAEAYVNSEYAVALTELEV